MATERTPWWAWTWPAVAWVILLMTLFAGAGGLIAAAAGAALIATVFAAVYHAEVVAHRTGEPFGTLVLAVAVTVIEVALIVSVMVAAPAEKAGLARDTVFAAVMIVMQRHRRPVPALGRRAPSRTGISAPRSERRPGRAGRAHQPDAGCAKLRRERSRSDVQHIAAHLRRGRLAGALRLVRFRPDRAAPRLLPPARSRRRGGARAAALQQDGRRQRRTAARLARGRRGTCEISHADGGGGNSLAWRAKSCRGDRHRGAGVAARMPGGAQGGPSQPIADQFEPGVGIGARRHRPDDPGGCARFDRALASPSSLAWAKRTKLCWR